jgi:2-octaprenyl-3-methyl-6-methoxy-1,4-benzoquinol hydroxylase
MRRRGLHDVVVVGAGVVGAAAALAFARDGLRVALVEAREPPPWRAETPDLRVYAFAPDNATLLDDLGVWAAVRTARLQPYRSMRVWDAAGGDPLVFEADAFARRELGWIVEHALLVDRLWAALPAAGVEIHCPDRVTALDGLQDGGDGASLQLDSGLRLRARLVLAADGSESQLRSMAGIDVVTRDHGQSGLVAFIDTEHPHQETCWQRFMPTGPLAFLPFAGEDGRRSSIVWTLPEAEAARLQSIDETAFLIELEHAFDGPLGAMRSVSRRVAFPLRRQLAQAYVAGRVVVVGDAAHVVHPLAGQGVNLGLRDVAALRGSVREASRRGSDIASPARLSRWARQRRSENALAAHAFDGLNRLFSNDALLPTLMRGPLLGLAGRLPPLTHAFWKRAAGL